MSKLEIYLKIFKNQLFLTGIHTKSWEAPGKLETQDPRACAGI